MVQSKFLHKFLNKSFQAYVFLHLVHKSFISASCSKCEIIDAVNGSTCVCHQCLLIHQIIIIILRLQSYIYSSSITTNTEILILYFTTTAKQAEIKINIC